MDERPSIIVPVHDEAALLPTTLPPLLREAAAIEADLILVCNGCTDGSVALARSLVGESGRVIELEAASKSLAIRAGEDLVSGFPRFFVDADVVLGPGCLTLLAEALRRGHADLVAPRLRVDTSCGSRGAAAVTSVWHSLPHMAQDGLHAVLGVSRRGRAFWGPMPDVLADDSYIVSRVPPCRRSVVQHAAATFQPPRSLASWVGVRRRWTAGHAQLRALGERVPRSRGQRRALLQLFLSRRAFGAVLFAGVALASRLPASRPQRWYRDLTTRSPQR